jgi:hypothetical protein
MENDSISFKKMHYINVNSKKLNILLQELTSHGAEIQGVNPWDVCIKSPEPVLQIFWENKADILTVGVIDQEWIDGKEKIWSSIHKLVSGLHNASSTEIHNAIMILQA